MTGKEGKNTEKGQTDRIKGRKKERKEKDRKTKESKEGSKELQRKLEQKE